MKGVHHPPAVANADTPAGKKNWCVVRQKKRKHSFVKIGPLEATSSLQSIQPVLWSCTLMV